MPKNLILKTKNAQTAVEYMLLLAAVVAIVLVGLKQYLPRFQQSSNLFFNRVTSGIYGEPNRCGDGLQGNFENCCNCPADFKACDPNNPVC